MQKSSLLKAFHQLLGYAATLRSIRGCAILTFHSVRDIATVEYFPWVQALTITPDFLVTLIAELRRQNISIVSISEAIQRAKSRDASPSIAITFDDGYADNFRNAFPLFQKHRVPFTIFLTTGFIDRTVPMWWTVLDVLIRENDRLTLPNGTILARDRSEKQAAFTTALKLFSESRRADKATLIKRLTELYPNSTAFQTASAKPLDWHMIRMMAQSGLATIGSHTVSHPILSSIGPNEIAKEIYLSCDAIEAHLGERPKFFAYPYGSNAAIGPDAPGLAAKAGFEAAFTTRRALLVQADLETPFLLPRITVSGHYQHKAAVRAYLMMAENKW